jgi:hypothetical protein
MSGPSAEAGRQPSGVPERCEARQQGKEVDALLEEMAPLPGLRSGGAAHLGVPDAGA